jgi:maleate isomerase
MSLSGRRKKNALRTRLERKVAGTTLILPTLATVAALRALRINRIAIMHPPWFSAEMNANGERYYPDMDSTLFSASE